MSTPHVAESTGNTAYENSKLESSGHIKENSESILAKEFTPVPLSSNEAVETQFSTEKDEESKPSLEESNEFSHFNNKLSIQDFNLLKVLGKGSFGKVMLVRRCDEKCNEGERDTLYALKTLRKSTLITRNQLAHTATERQILQDLHSPFLVHLVYAFQTIDKLYMVLDYMGGGELFFWLRKEKRFSENRCRLYAAEIGLALDAMHKENIVYRDLKPENVLLDGAGHIKLTDFGLAKGMFILMIVKKVQRLSVVRQNTSLLRSSRIKGTAWRWTGGLSGPFYTKCCLACLHSTTQISTRCTPRSFTTLYAFPRMRIDRSATGQSLCSDDF